MLPCQFTTREGLCNSSSIPIKACSWPVSSSLSRCWGPAPRVASGRKRSGTPKRLSRSPPRRIGSRAASSSSKERHSAATGAAARPATARKQQLSPADVQRRYAANRHDPLFARSTATMASATATRGSSTRPRYAYQFPLPPNIWLHDDPAATSVTVFRGIASTKNSPALDPLITFDTREPDLETQAANAILAHFQPTVTPTRRQLEKIADYERTLFSSRELRRYAHGGPEPELPRGCTPSEKRGRKHFLPNQLCGQCHSGPMLNTASDQFVLGPFLRITGVLAGFSGQVSAPPRRGQRRTRCAATIWSPPVRREQLPLLRSRPVLPADRRLSAEASENGILSMLAAYPAYALVLGSLDGLGDGKTTSLWGINETAPYFHDNSAHTLEDVVHHYKLMFEAAPILATPLGANDDRPRRGGHGRYTKLLVAEGPLPGRAGGLLGLRPGRKSAPSLSGNRTSGHTGHGARPPRVRRRRRPGHDARRPRRRAVQRPSGDCEVHG